MNYGSDRGQQSFDYSAPYLPRWKALPLVVSALAVIALPFVAAGDSQDFSSSQSTSPVVHHRPIDQIALSTFEDTTPLKTDEVEQAWEHTQITYVDLRTGAHLGSGAERLARASLSLSKLYIADYVFDHGTQKEKEQAVEMIRKSDDDIADKLFDAHPNCIDSVAKKYQLEATQTYGRWGYSYTSTYDVVHFIVSLLRTDPDSPVLEAMRNVAPKAADGTDQDFGTAILSGVQGSKFGWSTDGELHSSVSFGEDFVVAVSSMGSADDLTQLVKTQLSGHVRTSAS
ncbi:hypothetical protein FRC0119_00778 [Corynebacterium diphtheriae]|nr:hypothetical protein FRC0119_00778 [Corynebacterium diphtheriae]CAB0769778.1 hypothetical protein FRC0160_00777 [Corynebacterium diphtheriae]CAB0769861.1 hypothetical protein FRC0156_00751 [Corynebacterium diphtheriae]CAB0792363.1 hypothetical protein FRC0210_00768 [Corynebacterium diphtheriae]CAB0811857.1 hypothetical protein FRC0291_00818 [Corynebacterium diphtheriae]